MREKQYRGSGGGGRDVFLAEVLRVASLYSRAAGYFSSSVFAVAPKEFVDFIRRGGRMRLVCSPRLSSVDIQCLYRVWYWPRRQERSSCAEPPFPDSSGTAADFFEWCLRERAVAVKFAVLRPEAKGAMYHEKFGVVVGRGGHIAFFGSANETRNGYMRNFELVRSYDVAACESDRELVRNLDCAFDALWEDRTPGLDVVDVDTAFRLGLLQETCDEQMPRIEEHLIPPLAVPRETLRCPEGLELRTFQKEAIQKWLANDGKGILAMATGSGKTIAALSAAEKVLEACGPPLVLVVVAPYLHLVDQWDREARRFGLHPIKCTGMNPGWREEVPAAIFSVNAEKAPVLSVITTNATFASSEFASVISLLRVRTMLIADEVHNLGAAQLCRALPRDVSLRMGLSATPERQYDVTGSKALEEYFGGVVFRFELRDAIQADPPVLTPYRYYPVLVEMDEGEAEEYERITDAIARQIANADDEALGAVALALLIKRARLLASVRGKLPALKSAITPYVRESHTIVYGGDGRQEVDAVSGIERSNEDEGVARQIELVVRLLGHGMGMNIATYTAETALEDRERLRQEFATGRKQVLVAIRCLDEGVDFPEARRAFILASSTNPRQFIQRRGRLLRRSEGKGVAEIFDFVVSPPVGLSSGSSTSGKTMQRLFRKEMERAVEFAKIAMNGPQAMNVFLPLLKELDLLDLA